MTPRKPDSRASSGVISGKPIGVIESTSIAPSSMRYRAPTLTWGRAQIRTLQVISPRRTPSRSRLVNTMKESLHLAETGYALHYCDVDVFNVVGLLSRRHESRVGVIPQSAGPRATS